VYGSHVAQVPSAFDVRHGTRTGGGGGGGGGTAGA